MQCMSNTGVAENIAWLFIQPSLAIGGEAALLSALYIVTALLSEILTNNAAAALMYPIGQIAGDALGEKNWESMQDGVRAKVTDMEPMECKRGEQKREGARAGGGERERAGESVHGEKYIFAL
eukprot:366400-Chlamydomonas_euryale.AAC.17